MIIITPVHSVCLRASRREAPYGADLCTKIRAVHKAIGTAGPLIEDSMKAETPCLPVSPTLTL